MQSRYENKRWKIVQNTCTPWSLYYVVLCTNFAATLYVNKTAAIPYGLLCDPKCMYLFIAVYMFFCVSMSSPRAIVRRDHHYRTLITNRVSTVVLLCDMIALALLAVIMTYDNANTVILLVIVLQCAMYMEMLLVLLVPYVNKRAVETFLAIRIHEHQTNIHADYNYSCIRMLWVLWYVMPISLLVYMSTVQCIAEYSTVPAYRCYAVYGHTTSSHTTQ